MRPTREASAALVFIDIRDFVGKQDRRYHGLSYGTLQDLALAWPFLTDSP